MRVSSLKTLLVVALQLTFSSAALAQSTAVTEETIDGKVYEVERAEIKASPEKIFSILTDYKAARQLFDNLKSCRVLESHDNHDGLAVERNVAFSLAGIARIYNFNYVLTLKETFPSQIEWHRLSGAFKTNDGFWRIEPAEDGESRVTFAKSIDGGFLPQSFVNAELRQTMPKVMGNLKLLAEKQ